MNFRALLLGLPLLLVSSSTQAQITNNNDIPAEIMYMESDLLRGQRSALNKVKRKVLDEIRRGKAMTLLMGGIQLDYGAPPLTWISPLSETTALTKVNLQAPAALSLVSAEYHYTGKGDIPKVTSFAHQDKGLHILKLDPAPAPGEWLEISLQLKGPTGKPYKLQIRLAHLPCDINQDHKVDIYDGQVFGLEWRGARRPELLDINGDGKVDILDVTAFANNWEGHAPSSRAWQSASLPPKP